MVPAASNRRPAQRGATLVELIIGSTIAATVTILATFVMINTTQTQVTVSADTVAATQGQAAAALIDRAIRTATDFATAPAGTPGQLKACYPGGRSEGFRFVPATDDQPGRLEHRGPGASRWTTLARPVNAATFAREVRPGASDRLVYTLGLGASTTRVSSTHGALLERAVVMRNPVPEGSTCAL